MRVMISADALADILKDFFAKEDILKGKTMDMYFPEEADPDNLILVEFFEGEDFE